MGDKSKKKLKSVGYDWGYWWLKPSTHCGFDSSPTSEEYMMSVFSTEPKSELISGTPFAKLYHKNSYYIRGVLTNNLGSTTKLVIFIPLRSQITTSDYQHFFSLEHVF